MAELVVVVDDDDAIRDAMADLLTLDGYEVITASDGVEALRVLGGVARPCVAVIDLVMPRVDGWQLVRTILDDAALEGIAVICCTAGRGAAPEGCAAILRKPFDGEALVAAVQQAFRFPR